MNKKFLFIVVALVSIMLTMPILSFAQKGFEPQIKLRYDLGLGKDNVNIGKNQAFGAEFVAGYRFNQIARIGVGVGIAWCDVYMREGEKIGIIRVNEYDEDAVSIPIFVNGKFDFIKSKISPYFSLDLGYAAFVPCSDYAKDYAKYKLGFFTSPAIGVDFGVGKKTDLFVEIGYKFQMRKSEYLDVNNFSNMSFSVGCAF